MWFSRAAASPRLFLARATPDAFPAPWLSALRDAIVESPYLATSNLNARFSGTRGFSITFRRDGLAQVRDEFPLLGPYLDAVIAPSCNAFFLNPLVIGGDAPADGGDGIDGVQGGAAGGAGADGEGGRVAPHIDRSLRSFTQPLEPPNPQRVSVLYVQAPPGMHGGELRLYLRWLPLRRIRPRENLLVHFHGGLRHEVTPARLPVGTCRVSLVCEQYRVEDDVLSRVPRYALRSMSAFERFLEVEMER